MGVVCIALALCGFLSGTLVTGSDMASSESRERGRMHGSMTSHRGREFEDDDKTFRRDDRPFSGEGSTFGPSGRRFTGGVSTMWPDSRSHSGEVGTFRPVSQSLSTLWPDSRSHSGEVGTFRPVSRGLSTMWPDSRSHSGEVSTFPPVSRGLSTLWPDSRSHSGEVSTFRPHLSTFGGGMSTMRHDDKFTGGVTTARSDLTSFKPDDRKFDGDDSSTDYTPWWVRWQRFQPSYRGHSNMPFSPFFPSSIYPSRRTFSTPYPWSWNPWNTYFSRKFDDDLVDDNYPNFLSLRTPQLPARAVGNFDPSFRSQLPYRSTSWPGYWTDRSYGDPWRRDRWGYDWTPRHSASSWPWWLDSSSSSWSSRSPFTPSYSWRDSSVYGLWGSGYNPSFSRHWRRRNPWFYRKDYDSSSSREGDDDWDDYWPSRTSPRGRGWGRGFGFSGRSYDNYDSYSRFGFGSRSGYNSPLNRWFGFQPLRGGGTPPTAPPASPSTDSQTGGPTLPGPETSKK